MTRADGARDDVLKRVTHARPKDVFDEYTTFPWRTLCEAVPCLKIFGWTKTVGVFRKTRFKGVQRTDFASRLVGAAYNLRRMANLLPVAT